MPRQARLILTGCAVHVIQRGNDRKPCFLDDRDFLVYLALLGDLSAHAQCAIHAYCLMTNHVHILLTPRLKESCALLMHGIGQRYAAYFNRRYARTGTLWEGRFKSCLVDSADYALACYRYIEMNPVRAGIVSLPDQYPWSSVHGNCGTRNDPILAPHAEYEALGSTAYRALLVEELPQPLLSDLREAVNGGRPLGSQRFKDGVERSTGRRTTKLKPGPKKAEAATESSVAVPDLFSGGGVS
jgi:putative transposase